MKTACRISGISGWELTLRKKNSMENRFEKVLNHSGKYYDKRGKLELYRCDTEREEAYVIELDGSRVVSCIIER